MAEIIDGKALATQVLARTAEDVAQMIAAGAGWGLAGYCPGPALVSLGMGSAPAGVFVLAMLAGMAAHAWLTRTRA